MDHSTPDRAPHKPLYQPARKFNLAIALLDAWAISEKYSQAKTQGNKERCAYYLEAFKQIQQYVIATLAIRAVDRIPLAYDPQKESIL